MRYRNILLHLKIQNVIRDIFQSHRIIGLYCINYIGNPIFVTTIWRRLQSLRAYRITPIVPTVFPYLHCHDP